MTTFFDSSHCLTQAHCKACRSKEDNAFRKSIHAAFDDVERVNFKCPLGRTWGDIGKAKIAGSKVYKSGRRCRSCEQKIRNKQTKL
jgi:hypothetical protein